MLTSVFRLPSASMNERCSCRSVGYAIGCLKMFRCNAEHNNNFGEGGVGEGRVERYKISLIVSDAVFEVNSF